MKIVLLGTSGQVGGELVPRLAGLGELVACDRASADFTRPETIVALLQRERPQVIVNAVAFTAVDKAESEPDQARLVNATTVAAIAAEAARQDATLVHYSTDYVFDGTKAGPYVETDDPHPLSVYGATKLAGERAVAAAGCRHWIFRTSWVYAARGHNFVRTMLRLARDRDELRIVDDQVGTPTPAALIADVTAAFIGRSGGPTAPAAGTYHLAPHGETTWCGFARHILATARDLGVELRCPPERVAAIATSDYPLPARRPANSRLCTAKLEAALGTRLPEWQDGVAPVVAALAAEFPT
jgi:dTDP-4-dehydrorhamnose reductase